MQTQKLWNKYLTYDCRCHILYNYKINEVFSMKIQTFLPFQIPGRPGLDFASMKEDYPRFPDIHDLHIEFEDQHKIMVSLVNYFIT